MINKINNNNHHLNNNKMYNSSKLKFNHLHNKMGKIKHFCNNKQQKLPLQALMEKSLDQVFL